jgi:hypothetical protein
MNSETNRILNAASDALCVEHTHRTLPAHSQPHIPSKQMKVLPK